ncbi:MAG: putative flagellar protein FlgA precursor, partial [Ramlibacter sp.]|nr:putative flagellar protein FlgA precursor [Ramlibacter sp.]
MKPLLVFLSALLATAAVGAAATPAVSIELRPEVRAAGPVVTLGQLARLESVDLPLLRRLVDLPVGRAPAAGRSALVEREALLGWLRRRLGLEQQQVEWRGPVASRVSSFTRLVAGEDIAAAAAAAVHQWLGSRSPRSEASLAGTPRDVEAVQGELRLQPRALGQAALRRRLTVWVEVWAGERFVRVVPVTFAVAAWGEGLSAAQSLATGALVQGASLPGQVDLLAGAGAGAPLAGAHA